MVKIFWEFCLNFSKIPAKSAINLKEVLTLYHAKVMVA
jgi:hypothetical protein